jgi:hypothetical protein
MGILSQMLKHEKTGRIKRITMPMALLLPRWPATPLVSKVLISFGISGSLLIIMGSGHVQGSGLVPRSVNLVCDAHSGSASSSDSTFKVYRARLYRQSVHEVLTAVYKEATERVLGRIYALQAYPDS